MVKSPDGGIVISQTSIRIPKNNNNTINNNNDLHIKAYGIIGNKFKVNRECQHEENRNKGKVGQKVPQ